MRIRGKITICTTMVIMLIFCGSVYANETSAISSDTIHNIEEVNDDCIFGEPFKIGLAYYSIANDIYVIQKYAQFSANSSSTTKYVDVSGLSSAHTYWGCIVNNTSGVLSGTADILDYV